MLNTLRRYIIPAGALLLAACTFGFDPAAPAPTGGADIPSGETARVVAVIDGDTIDVDLNGQTVRVRYVGVNTPERDEVCYRQAVEANRILVSGKTVTLVRDVSETDRFGRLLRYVYADGIFVNRALVEQGYAEVVLYRPDGAHFETFRQLEIEAKTPGAAVTRPAFSMMAVMNAERGQSRRRRRRF
jgi:endonuclease YncB( thermonuclease family)